MAAVVEAFVDAISDVVEAVGDVLEDVVELAEDVVTFVAENPLLLVAAIAAPYALGAFAAEAGVVGALEIATAAEAIEVGTAVLEATELATAVASAEVAAATTVIEAGATIAEATAAATAVAEGATVAEAVTVATGGAVEVSAIAEVATTAASEVASTSAWETLSQAAQNITTTIGETLAPGADASIQKIIGQVALNTATNGGDLEKGLESTFLSLGTGFLGSEVASATGSDLAGRVAANATNQLVRTGDVNLTGLASGEIGRLVGSEVADETGSNLLGKAATSVTSSTLQGKDATTGLLNLGISEGINTLFNAGNDLITGAPKAETVSDITGDTSLDDFGPFQDPSRNMVTKIVSDTDDNNLSDVTDVTKSIDVGTVLDEDKTPVGGLAAVTQTPAITTSDDAGSTAVTAGDTGNSVDRASEVKTINTFMDTLNNQGVDAANDYLKSNNISTNEILNLIGGSQEWADGMGVRGVIPDDLSTLTSVTPATTIIDNLADVTKVTSPVIDTVDDVDVVDLPPVTTGTTTDAITDAITTATTPATTVTATDEDDLQKQIDAIIAPEIIKSTDLVSTDDVLSPSAVTSAVDEVPAGGLNIIQQTQTDEPKVAPVTGEVKAATTSSNIPLAGSGIVSGLIKSNLTKSLSKALNPTKKPAGGLKTALKPVMPVKKVAAAPKMDISKLMPIKRAPVKPTAPKGTLTPVKNIAGLTSMLKKKTG